MSKLRLFEKYLTLEIFSAMALGIFVGYSFPSFSKFLSSLSIGTTSLPIALGLILMMYPPLAKVKYEKIGSVLFNKKILLFSMFQNWIFGPFLMFFLAALLLRDYPEYAMGVIMVGLARCIAMVIVWNDLARGDRELAVGLVALNALFQILTYSFYIYIFLNVIPSKLEIFRSVYIDISIYEVAKTVFIFLGIPFIAGFLTRKILRSKKGDFWYENEFSRRISIITPVALLYTIFIMFSLKGENIVELPYHVFRIALPLTAYFFIMWFITYFVATNIIRTDHKKATALAFSAASNDFELAIAVAIGMFGINSMQAFATVIGPLLEVPILLSLVNVSMFLQNRRVIAV